MDDTTPANEPNEQGLNKIDLSQLQSFNFGTQWTEVKPVSPGRRERDFDRGDRRDRREGGGKGAPQRDRRSFQKPAGSGEHATGTAAPAGPGQPPRDGNRRFDRGPGGPRREHRGDPREGGGQAYERAPYISPYFTATCYPEDTGFAAIVKAVRASCRTFQLFEITKAVLEKNDRFVVVIQRTRPAAPEGQPAPKPAPMFMSLPDHLPFDTEEAAIQHALGNNLGAFFEMQEVDVDPPKGNFPIINKCGITGDLLGPPNYHRYQQILQQHHSAKLSHMSFERFRDSVISVREPEVVTAWLDKMRKATRYTWKQPVPKNATNPPGEVPIADTPAENQETPAAPVETTGEEPAAPVETAGTEQTSPAEMPVSESSGPVPTPADVISFDSIEDARLHLLTHARDKVVRVLDSVRFHGKNIEKLPPGEIRRALEGHVERQRRFPLDTANALRGRLRRESFTIFKKGSRGVSYVCAVKRRFRVPGQVFSESISSLIDFIEKHPMVPVKDLPGKYLGIDVPAPATPSPEPTPVEAEPTTPSQSPFASLAPDQAEKLRKMSNDLRWLVMEGYVTEFSDSKLYAPPPVEPQGSKKRESNHDEHDPVDFPDAAANPETPVTDMAVESIAVDESVAATVAVDAPATKAAPVESMPAESTPTTEQVSPAEPTAPAEPAEPTVPTEPAASVEPAVPTEPEAPAEPAPPAEETKPGIQS